ncbi:MAG: amidohydrolase family protein, partial [Armatimonadetes bacterium]|nr:amidohydrolase family protein [Armatimonadota bacterium]
PGFLDIHTHVYAGVTSWGVFPDPPCLASGVTTAVDAGSPGWTMLQGFRWLIHDRSTVRVLCFLHISGVGLVNAWVNECEDISHLHPQTVGENVAENRDLVVGVKVRQGRVQVGEHGTKPLHLAIQAAEIAGTPLMCHIAAGIPLAAVLDPLRPGDIITHCYQGRGEEGENLTDARGRLLPEVVDARQKGVVMDVGHGGGSFRWEVAEAALEHGFLPDVISTDLHAYNMHGPLYDMQTTLTKFLSLGLSLEQVVERATSAPARAIGRPELGTLTVGAPADLAVFRIRDEPIRMLDTHSGVRNWDRQLRVEATVRAGVIYRPEEQRLESREEITRRCRTRGDDPNRMGVRPFARRNA